MHTSRASLTVVSLVVVLLLSLSLAQPALAQSAANEDEGSTISQAGLGAASFLATIPYGVAKLAFAAGGGIVGGLAYIFSGANTETAQNIWTTSMYGTYVITPDHLRGNRPVRFLGVPEDRGDRFYRDEPPR